MNVFVYIVESPSAQDLLDGRTEGRVLSEALQLAGIRYGYSLVVDHSTLLVALEQRLSEVARQHQCVPILHLSMHGNQSGVQLTNGHFLTWHDLREALLSLNRAMAGGLLICMSACFGVSGCRMAMYEDGEPTFWALVGNAHSPTWADAAVAYVAFYHRLFKGATVEASVEAMKQASGDPHFAVLSGQEMKVAFLTELQKIRVEQWQAFLNSLVAPVPGSSAPAQTSAATPGSLG